MKRAILTCGLSLLITWVFCITDEEQAMFTSNHHGCVDSSSVDIITLERAYEGDVTDDVNLKDYITCFFTKSGFQGDDGQMRYDRIRSFMPHMARTSVDDPEQTIMACEGRKLIGDTPAETAFLNFKCYLGTM